jgi:diguanylate cyclase (GGDEF)-like protein
VRLVSVLPVGALFANADRQMMVSLVTLLVEAAIITFLMMALIEYMLLGALRSLVRVAEKITAGDVAVRATVKTPFTDLHVLAKAFNVMVDRLERAALIDGLTKLPNRRHLDQHCDLSMKRYQRYGLPFSVAMIDVDRFKLYNDHYGHSAGDQVLSQISAVLSDFVRRSDDLAGRYGGEEFLLVLAESDPTKVAFHLDRLRVAVERLAISHRGTGLGSVTVSIGFAIVQEDDTVASLIDRADQSLYAVKANGRNGVLCLEEPDAIGQIDSIRPLAESA